MKRCAWCCGNEIVEKYHDEEWGNVLHDDRKHFEYLLMEVMQCGLNWTMMLKKREVFRQCFAGFDYEAVSEFDEADIQKILQQEGMIRSRRKIEAIINNAERFRQIIQEFGSFDTYLWAFSNHKTFVYHKHQEGFYEAKNELSDRISADLKKRGFKYLGSITVYSHLQACGMINDHECDCWKYSKLLKEGNIEFV